MLSKCHNQAQYQLSLKINMEKGGRRVRNLLPYEQACWQPAPVPCTLNVPAQEKVNLVHIWETCYYHLLHQSLQTETGTNCTNTSTLFHPKLHMCIDQGNGNQLRLEYHKETRLGSSAGSQLPRAMPQYASAP